MHYQIKKDSTRNSNKASIEQNKTIINFLIFMITLIKRILKFIMAKSIINKDKIIT